MRPDRIAPPVFGAMVYPTVPLPVPEPPDVMLTKSGLLFKAVQPHVLALAVTVKLPAVPAGSA